VIHGLLIANRFRRAAKLVTPHGFRSGEIKLFSGLSVDKVPRFRISGYT